MIDNSDFRFMAERAFGFGWQTRASEFLGVTSRCVRRWVSDQGRAPKSALDALRARLGILPPKPGATDADCLEAISPEIRDLVHRAVSVGWSEARVRRALHYAATLPHQRSDTPERAVPTGNVELAA